MSSGWSAEKVLCHLLQGIGKVMVQGSWRDVAAVVLKSEPLRTLVIEQILKDMNVECSHLCGRGISISRQSTPQKLVSIWWADIVDEWKKQCPFFP